MEVVGLSGLYTRLKDKDLPLAHKLQLLRFAWKSAQVVIPNKEQVLIDLLTGYLLNKKKYQLTDEEVSRVWQCLCDVLKTKKAHVANKQGQGLVIKQSICQVILEALTLAIPAEVVCPYLGSLIGCCQTIITSPTLSYIFTGRLDQLLSLLGVLCSLLVKHVDDGNIRNSLTELTELIDETVKVYLKAQKTAPNQKQILQWCCAKVLPNFLSVWSLSRTSCYLADPVDKLCNVLGHTLFHKDHQEMYIFYLNMKYGDQESAATKKPVKLIEQVFSTLQNFTIDKKTDTDAVCLYIPVLFESFVKANCHNSNMVVAHHMLRECCNLIGVKPDSAALCGPASQAVVVKGVNQLLKTVQRLEVYNESADEKGRQLQYYRHLVAVLLENICFTPDWYSCITVLLQLNHQFLEPSLSEILLNSWLSLEDEYKPRVAGSLDDFLQELVTTYQKLRQFQKLMTKLLDTLKKCTSKQYMLIPARFQRRFGEVVQSLPQGMTIGIWKMFVQNLKENHVAREREGHFQGVCTLLCQYLLNVKVTDYSTTDITTNAVHDLMVAMETEILKPLLQRSKEDKETASTILLPTLQMCHVWGELIIMLAQYSRYRADSFTAKPQIPTSPDLSYVHSYLIPKDWMKIHKRVYKLEDKKLLHLWEMLELQQIRAQLLFSSSGAVNMTTLFDLPIEVSPENMTATWHPSVNSVDESNYLVAKWHLLASNMSSSYKALTREQCYNIACFIVQTADKVTDRNSESVSLYKTTDDLLSSAWIKEFSLLQSSVVTATWRNFGHCFSCNLKSGKKRKSSSSATDLRSVLTMLGDVDMPWHEGLTSSQTVFQTVKILIRWLLKKPSDLDLHCLESETGEQIQQISGSVNRLLNCEDSHTDRPDVDKMQIYLKVLEKLPVEHMSSCDQLRCLFGLLSLTAHMANCTQTEKPRTSLGSQPQNEASQSQSEAAHQKEAVLSQCLKLMMVLLEASGTASVFQLLNIQSCLDWLQRLQKVLLCQRTSTVYLRLLMFVEMSCSSMVKDYQVLEKLPTVVQEICSEIKHPTSTECDSAWFVISCFLTDLSKFLNRPYLNDSLKAICSEMFVSIATVVTDCVKAIAIHGHSRVSCHVVKCLTAVIATNLAAEVKGELMSASLDWFECILDWCLKSLQKIEDNNKLTALNCLLVFSKHHKDFHDSLPALKKLDIWNTLMAFLQTLLHNQSNTSDGRGPEKYSAENQLHEKETNQIYKRKADVRSHDSETGQSDAKKTTASRKEKRRSSDLFVENKLESAKDNSVEEITKLLDVTEDRGNVDLIVPFRTSYIKLLDKSVTANISSNVNSENFMSTAAIHSLYRTLVYEGKWESESSKVILVQVQSVIAAMVMNFDLEGFTKVIQGIVEDVIHGFGFLRQHQRDQPCDSSRLDKSTRSLDCDVQKLQCSLYIWQRLLKLDLSQEQAGVVAFAAQNLMLNFQSIVEQLGHHGDERLLMSVAVPVVRAQEQMLSLGQAFLSPQTAVMCLHSCQFLPLDGSTYFPSFHAACSVLDTLLMNHTEAVLKTIPSYLSCAKRLLLSVVQNSSQETVQGDKELTEQLVDCAYHMERLFTQISTHKVDFGKVALYVVSDYVSAVQKVTLVPAIKRALVPAIYKMLDLCDKHSIAQLHTVLSHGVCEVFKLLYSDYNKYYRYTGKI